MNLLLAVIKKTYFIGIKNYKMMLIKIKNMSEQVYLMQKKHKLLIRNLLAY